MSQIWEAATAKRMKIDSYCQQQNCSPLNVLFSDVQMTLILLGIFPIGGLQLEYSGQKWHFQPLQIADKISRRQYVIWPRLLLTFSKKSLNGFKYLLVASMSLDFFARGDHTRTAVARLPLRQLGFLVSCSFAVISYSKHLLVG